jgi:hypothetical protein
MGKVKTFLFKGYILPDLLSITIFTRQSFNHNIFYVVSLKRVNICNSFPLSIIAMSLPLFKLLLLLLCNILSKPQSNGKATLATGHAGS